MRKKMMDTDDKGFVLSASKRGRHFTAIRISEFEALEKSSNRSLLALAKRIKISLEDERVRLETRARESAEKQQRLREAYAARRAAMTPEQRATEDLENAKMQLAINAMFGR